jgi:hypothetical protein
MWTCSLFWGDEKYVKDFLKSGKKGRVEDLDRWGDNIKIGLVEIGSEGVDWM